MLSIIILNYNNTYHTIQCLFSLQKQTYSNFEIILIENNSNDVFRKKLYDFLESDALEKPFKKIIRLIESNTRNQFLNEVNLGFTGGNNLGLKKAKGELILLLNNDTCHEPTFLESMVHFFNKYKNLHIAQPKICFYPEKKVIWCNGGKINAFSHELFSIIDFMEIDNDFIKNKPFKIDFAAGTALFVRKNILQKIGLLDEIYFMYCEESDLCYRANIMGYKNIYCIPTVKIYHNIQPGLSENFKKYYFRNRMVFCLKNFPTHIIMWQFFMQFIQLFILTVDSKKKKIDIEFFLKSIIGILNGLKIGIRIRLKINKFRKKKTP